MSVKRMLLMGETRIQVSLAVALAIVLLAALGWGTALHARGPAVGLRLCLFHAACDAVLKKNAFII